MVYRDFCNRVLQLMNQYTIAGEEVALTYNAQFDYIARIPGLLDSAQQYLATTTKPIYATMPLDWRSAEERGGFYVIQMPDDFWQLCGRGLFRIKDGEFSVYHGYRWFGRDKIIVPIQDEADMELTYYRYPHSVPAEPDDTFELDNLPDAQDAAAYYVAANLVMYDNPFAYSALYNEFENRRQQMFERPQAEYEMVENTYTTPGDGVYCV